MKVDFCILCGRYPILPLHLHKEIPWGGSSTAVGLNLSFLTDKRQAMMSVKLGKADMKTVLSLLLYIKFRYSEKAIEMLPIFHL